MNTDNVTDNTTPTFDIGGVESGATVTLTCQVIGGGGPIVVQAVAGGSSCAITVTPPLSQGVYVITARQTDLAGNVSAVSSAMAPILNIAVAPSVTTQAATDVASSTATGNGTIIALGTPNPTAYGFVWNTTGSPTLSDSFTNDGSPSSAGAFTGSFARLNPNSSYYVRAYATNSLLTVYGNEVTFSTLETFTLTYTAGAGGSITGTTPQTVDYGTSGAAVTAVPDTGYHFVDWSDGVLTPARTELNITGDISVTANFAIDTHTLGITAVNGSVTKDPDQSTFDYGSSVQLTAVPSAGYHFVNWSGDASSSDNPVTVIMDSNKTVTAKFAVDSIPVTERAALIAFYDSTNGDSWTNNAGWRTPPLHTDGFAMPGTEGAWFGIGVDAGTLRVTSIDLCNNNLTGVIAPELGSLSSLNFLRLSSNPLGGTIPARDRQPGESHFDLPGQHAGRRRDPARARQSA